MHTCLLFKSCMLYAAKRQAMVFEDAASSTSRRGLISEGEEPPPTTKSKVR